MPKLEFTDAENRLDSGMSPTEDGEPFTQGECDLIAEGADDDYPGLAFRFLIRRVHRLALENASLRQEVDITRKLHEALRNKNAELARNQRPPKPGSNLPWGNDLGASSR